MKLAPNVAMQFTDLPMEDRIRRAADLGFAAVDMFGTKEQDVRALGKVLRARKMAVTMIVGSELARGLNDAALHEEIVASATSAAQDAQELNGLNVVVLSGNTLPSVPASRQNRNIIDGLKRLAPVAEKFNVTIVLEMLNSLYDHPGYYLDSTELMVALVRAAGHPRIKALYDLYHAGIMRGNLIEDVRASMDAIGHFHVAGIPGRHEPKSGEQNYPFICRAIDEAGYAGYIGLEYSPLKEASESLRETKAWLEGG